MEIQMNKSLLLIQQPEEEPSSVCMDDLGAESLTREDGENKQLKAKVLDLEKKVYEIKGCVEIITKERDSLRMQLEFEFKQRAFEDEELRKKVEGCICSDQTARVRE
ncbi:hypothetical protein KP509_34G036800 [Ceratopteris richardii]|uniref:Uncharacterized protein n=1 Tax=Ceratopteris richardii TaxID=49495 RepID=A0A8T2QKJ9_CERRI|nr:hypothetical protein KP509_34G036800 [Ceratopteris richardii]